MCARLYVHYKHLGTLIKEDWTPSDTEKMLFERLLRYYLMHDLNTYITLPNHVMIYIYTHGFRLHMDNFSDDAILRTTMENYLRTEATNVKRSFQQMVICAHTKPGSLPLLQLTRHFLQEHWIGAVEDPPNEFHLCSIANFREIACRIQDEATMTVASSKDPSLVTTLPKGNEEVLADQQEAIAMENMVNKSRCIDTGFWRMVEDELEERIAKFGYSRNAPEWVKWRHMIIKRDQDRFGTPTSSLVFNNAEWLTQNDEQDRVHSRESDFAFFQSLNLAQDSG
ncbi:hypothetical protein FRC12_015354 [Ceratobasidium sp. 428]|nr:hypothetical protein FRC12_015354 [Ceratobasidium sp. 428]